VNYAVKNIIFWVLMVALTVLVPLLSGVQYVWRAVRLFTTAPGA